MLLCFDSVAKVKPAILDSLKTRQIAIEVNMKSLVDIFKLILFKLSYILSGVNFIIRSFVYRKCKILIFQRRSQKVLRLKQIRDMKINRFLTLENVEWDVTQVVDRVTSQPFSKKGQNIIYVFSFPQKIMTMARLFSTIFSTTVQVDRQDKPAEKTSLQTSQMNLARRILARKCRYGHI